MADALLAILVEDMDTRGIDSNLDVVAGLSGRTRGNSCNNVLIIGSVLHALEAEVEIDLCTHKLGNVNVNLHGGISHGAEVHGLVVDSLGTNTEDNLLADVLLEVGVVSLVSGKLDLGNTESSVKIVTLLNELAGKEVHLRSTDEACKEEVAGRIVKVLRSINLLDDTVLHNNDTGCHGHSLDLVVSNVDEGGLDLLVKLGKLGSHACTELCVKVGERLVKKEYLGVTNDSTAESNSLLLTTGKSLGTSLKKVRDIKDSCSLLNASLDLLLGNLTKLKTECHVVKYGHVRIKSVVLEHHRDISVLRSYVVNVSVAYLELALGDLLKTCDHTKGGRLTASRGTNEDKELLISDLEIEVGYGGNAAGVLLVNVSERKTCHFRNLLVNIFYFYI